MNFHRISYRIAQFRNALFARPARKDLGWVQSILTPEQMALFTQLHRSEQAHSLAVLKKLARDGRADLEEENRDLMVAALLHDVGKTLYPIRIWERVWIVLARALFPKQIRQWGIGKPAGWRRAFVIAEQHAEWGAQLAAGAGASSLTVALIRDHQNHNPQQTVDLDDGLLHRLQVADQDS